MAGGGSGYAGIPLQGDFEFISGPVLGGPRSKRASKQASKLSMLTIRSSIEK